MRSFSEDDLNKAKRLDLSTDCRDGRWFVVVASTGREHCGPYSTFDQAWDWIQEVRED